MKDTRKPPKPVRNAAQKALDWLEDGTVSWGTAAGHRRARRLAAGEDVPLADIRKMHAYFARHAKSPGEHAAKGWGDNKNPSKGYAAWLGWGGDPGRTWADGIVAKLD